MIIRPLADCAGVAGDLARLMQAAWPAWYGPDGDGDAAADLAARNRDAGLPYGLVAFVGGAPVGTTALNVTSHGAEPGEDCWLTGLVTAPAHRRRGVASALARAAVDAAGARVVFATTIRAEALLARQGWQRVRVLPDGHVVMRGIGAEA